MPTSRRPVDWLSRSAGWHSRSLFLSQTSPVLLEAVLRLVRLLETFEDIPTLAPLAIREII